MKKSNNISVGLSLVVLGILWILNNLGVLDINITMVIRWLKDLWPLILILLGLSIIFKNPKMIIIFFVVVIVVFIAYGYFTYDNYATIERNDISSYREEFQEGVNYGEVELDLGGIEFEITSGTSDFMTIDSNADLKHETELSNGVKKVYVSNDHHNLINLGQRVSKKSMSLSINETIPWKIDLDCGAVQAYLNLKDVKLKKLDIDAGVGDLEILLGLDEIETEVDIDSGVSEIILNIPKESGVLIKLDGALKSTNLSELDLIRENDDLYKSKNFDQATTKYNIDVDMGIGEFKIVYY